MSESPKHDLNLASHCFLCTAKQMDLKINRVCVTLSRMSTTKRLPSSVIVIPFSSFFFFNKEIKITIAMAIDVKCRYVMGIGTLFVVVSKVMETRLSFKSCLELGDLFSSVSVAHVKDPANIYSVESWYLINKGSNQKYIHTQSNLFPGTMNRKHGLIDTIDFLHQSGTITIGWGPNLLGSSMTPITWATMVQLQYTKSSNIYSTLTNPTKYLEK